MRSEHYGKAKSCIAPNCPRSDRMSKGYCALHYQRLLRLGSIDDRPFPRGSDHGMWKGGRLPHQGYVRVQVLPDDTDFDHATPIGGGRYIFEHRLVMGRHLGRPLMANENVHHIDGDKTNNDISNLELWSKSQPPGQRVSDKVAWAEEILRLYKPEALAQQRSTLLRT